MDDAENPHGPFFQRFSRNPTELARKIEQASAQLTRARAAGDEMAQLVVASPLGNLLTIARQEAAAAELLEWALTLARRLGNRHEEAGVLLNLATARQYLGERDEAQKLFEAALDRGDAELEHFIQHHRGRCYVEQGKKGQARLCFERALALRKASGEPRAASSERALAELDLFPSG